MSLWCRLGGGGWELLPTNAAAGVWELLPANAAAAAPDVPGTAAALALRPYQSVRRSPDDVEKTCVSPARGTTCSRLPFSGTWRPLTRTTRSLTSPPTSAVP